MNRSRVPSLVRVLRGGGRSLVAPPAVLLVVLLSGCATGHVTTSTGAIVPAATVRASYFDGCNWHTPLAGGGWGSTAMSCSAINANHMW